MLILIVSQLIVIVISQLPLHFFSAHRTQNPAAVRWQMHCTALSSALYRPRCMLSAISVSGPRGATPPPKWDGCGWLTETDMRRASPYLICNLHYSAVSVHCTAESSNCIEFWQQHKDKYPKLYQLHIRHHIIPATSAGIERAFSLAGYICSDRRNRLGDSLFESLLVAKANKDLLWPVTVTIAVLCTRFSELSGLRTVTLLVLT